MSLIENGTVEPINVMVLDSRSDPLTGKTDIKMKIRRISDGFFLDWDDYAFKTAVSVTQLLVVLTEVSVTYSPGEYQTSFDTSSITNAIVDDTYEITVIQDGGVDAKNLPQVGEIKVGHWLKYSISADTVVLQSYSFDPITSFMTGMAWVEKGSLVISTPTNCQFKLYDSDGVEIFDESDASPDSQGFFKITKEVSLTKNVSYYATAVITLSDSSIVSGGKGMFTIG